MSLRDILSAVLTAAIFFVSSQALCQVVDISVAPIDQDPVTIMFYKWFPFTLTDSDGDDCTVYFEYSLDGANWEPGRPPSYQPSYSASPGGSTYNWSFQPLDYSDTPIADEDVSVWLRATATDDDGSSSDQIGPFLLLNQPRGWFSDLTSEPYALGGPWPLSAGCTLHLRNTFAAHPVMDMQNPCVFFFYVNGTFVGWSSQYIYHVEDGTRGVGAVDVFIPDDFPYAEEYILEMSGQGFSMIFEPISGPIEIRDVSWPQISHTPVTGPLPAGQDIPVAAEVTDNQIVMRAAVKYRLPGGAWQEAEMINTGGDTYAGVIPGAAAVAPAVEYFVAAWDSRNLWTDPLGAGPNEYPSTPYSIAIEDTAGPVVTSPAAVPTFVREGVDDHITLTALASDASTGNGDIAGAEFFIGGDPGPGNGTPMAAADGAFDSPVEGILAALDTSSWHIGLYVANIRARDATGNFGPTVQVEVPVVEGVLPGRITDLAAQPLPGFVSLATTVAETSGSSTPDFHLVDGDPLTDWLTLGTLQAETEYFVLDLGEAKDIGAVALAAGKARRLFPAQFSIEVSADASDWLQVAAADAFRPVPRLCVWQFEPLEARYVKVSGPGMLNPGDHRYYWRVGEAWVYRGAASHLELTWTAPADDGYTGAPAAEYDLRCAAAPITEATFDACDRIGPLPPPALPGASEREIVGVAERAGTVYLAIKAADEIPNWSDMSNVAEAEAAGAGFESIAPDDGSTASAPLPPVFEFSLAPDARAVFIAFSSCPGFPLSRAARGGRIDRTLRYPVGPGASSWQPSPGQWKAIKGIVCAERTLCWRLEGRSKTCGTIFGPSRSMFFDCGAITNLNVSPSHAVGADQAVWPDRDAAPTFSWTADTTDMEYIYIDVSTDGTVPMNDRKRTVKLGGAGIQADSYVPTPREWKKIRRLATWLERPDRPSPACGMLHWRVRATDSQRTVSCASEVKTLIVDGGEWWLSDLDLGAAPPEVSWTHSGEGIVRYSLQFSHDGAFAPFPAQTVKIPAVSRTATSYSLKPRDLRRLAALARRRPTATLHYRVRGEDADGRFVAFSHAATTPAP